MKNKNDADPKNGRRTPLIGAQVSTAGGFAPVPERAVAMGAEAVQVFSSNPRTWQTRWPEPEETDALVHGLAERHLPLFFHTIYLINMASPDEALRYRSAQALAHALALGALAGAAGVVTHVGSHRGDGFEQARGRVVETALHSVELAEQSCAAQGFEPRLPPLLLETTVGAGAVVGGCLDEVAVMVDDISTALDGRIAMGICLDTAHLFAAGYPIHEADGLDSFIEALGAHGLSGKTGLVHLNDSSAAFASHRDRHENPGDGCIGYEGLGRVVRHPALSAVPFVLEVPGADGRGPDAANVAVVKRMRQGKALRESAGARKVRRARVEARDRPAGPAPDA